MDKHIVIHPLPCGSVCVPLHPGPFSPRRTLGVWCYLIEHPRGLFLVDTGLGDEALPLSLAAYYRPALPPEQHIAAQLAKCRVSPADLDIVILTSLDIDHTGGLHTLRSAKRVLASEEEYYWTCRTAFSRRQPKALWEDMKLETFYFRGTTLGPANHSYDLFGDGSVQLVLCPGHTFGNMALLLSQNGHTALLCGDTVSSSRTLRPFDAYDARKQALSQAWVKSVAAESACQAVLPTHDDVGAKRVITL